MSAELIRAQELADLLLNPTTPDAIKLEIYQDQKLTLGRIHTLIRYQALLSFTQVLRNGSYPVNRSESAGLVKYLEDSGVPYIYREHTVQSGKHAGMEQKFRYVATPDGGRVVDFFNGIPELSRYQIPSVQKLGTPNAPIPSVDEIRNGDDYLSITSVGKRVTRRFGELGLEANKVLEPDAPVAIFTTTSNNGHYLRGEDEDVALKYFERRVRELGF